MILRPQKMVRRNMHVVLKTHRRTFLGAKDDHQRIPLAPSLPSTPPSSQHRSHGIDINSLPLPLFVYRSLYLVHEIAKVISVWLSAGCHSDRRSLPFFKITHPSLILLLKASTYS